MATPGMQWAQLLAQMGSEGNNAIAQGMQAGTAAKNSDINQQREQLEAQQEQRQAEQYDQQVAQFAQDHGWKPIGPGNQVWDTVPMHPVIAALLNQAPQGQPPSSGGQPDTDSSGIPNPNLVASGTPGTSQDLLQAMNPQPAAGTLRVMRTADPKMTVKHKDATGDTVQWEKPDPNTPEGQLAISNAQAQVNWRAQMAARAEAQGRTEGAAAGAPRVPTSPEYLSDNNLPPGMGSIPESSAVALSRVTVPADTRAGAATDVAGIRARTAKDIADEKAATAAAQRDLLDAHFKAHETDQDTWNAAKLANQRFLSSMTTGRQKASQDAVDARNFRDNYARNMQLYSSLTKNLLGERQKQIAAQGLVNTADGETFTDPFDGKQKTMNLAQRMILKQRNDASTQAATGMQATINQLEQQRDGILQRMGGNTQASPTAGTAAAGPSGGAPAGASPAASPMAAAAGSSPTPVLPGRAHPTPTSAPSGRPYNWADAGRGAPAVQPTVPTKQYKVGDKVNLKGKGVVTLDSVPDANGQFRYH